MVVVKHPLFKKRLEDAIRSYSERKGTPAPGTRGVQQWLSKEMRKAMESVTPQGAGRWLRGEVMPRESALKALAKLFDLSVPHFRGYAISEDPLWARMEEVWNDLGEDALRGQVLGYAEAMLEKKPHPSKTKTARS